MALLRVLQEREFDRVGGTRPIHADARVITATHGTCGGVRPEPSKQPITGINVFPVKVPPLRERNENIRPAGVEYLIDRFASKAGKGSSASIRRAWLTCNPIPGPATFVSCKTC